MLKLKCKRYMQEELLIIINQQTNCYVQTKNVPEKFQCICSRKLVIATPLCITFCVWYSKTQPHRCAAFFHSHDFGKDFAGSLKMLAQIGYKEIEFYGPYPFSAGEDIERWKAITPSLGFSGSGYFGLTVQQVKHILDDNGLSSPSMHTGMFSLKNKMAEIIATFSQTGVKAGMPNLL